MVSITWRQIGSLLGLTLFLVGLAPRPAIGADAPPPALSTEARDATLRYVASLATADGGFRPDASSDAVPSLPSLVTALRARRYLGAAASPDFPRTFLDRCRVDGGFADRPGQPLSIRATALGLMAAAELKLPADERTERAVRVLARATDGEEIYMAVAALDAAGLTQSAPAAWAIEIDAARQKSGTYGASPFATATAVLNLLRLGKPVRNPEAVGGLIVRAQQPDGGFRASDTGASDLRTSYRMMRALSMLRTAPDLPRLTAFVSACRNADGGYGLQPGKPSELGATYYAAIILHWRQQFTVRPAAVGYP